MMTSEQAENWFTYHAPTEETSPKYAAIRDAEIMAAASVIGAYNSPIIQVAKRCEAINATLKFFALEVDRVVPDCADKAAAIRCIRIARNAANEAITKGGEGTGFTGQELKTMALQELLKARWQANAAIACGGK